jgi:hypothetical protein
LAILGISAFRASAPSTQSVLFCWIGNDKR